MMRTYTSVFLKRRSLLTFFTTWRCSSASLSPGKCSSWLSMVLHPGPRWTSSVEEDSGIAEDPNTTSTLNLDWNMEGCFKDFYLMFYDRSCINKLFLVFYYDSFFCTAFFDTSVQITVLGEINTAHALPLESLQILPTPKRWMVVYHENEFLKHWSNFILMSLCFKGQQKKLRRKSRRPWRRVKFCPQRPDLTLTASPLVCVLLYCFYSVLVMLYTIIFQSLYIAGYIRTLKAYS